MVYIRSLVTCWWGHQRTILEHLVLVPVPDLASLSKYFSICPDITLLDKIKSCYNFMYQVMCHCKLVHKKKKTHSWILHHLKNYPYCFVLDGEVVSSNPSGPWEGSSVDVESRGVDDGSDCVLFKCLAGCVWREIFCIYNGVYLGAFHKYFWLTYKAFKL